MVRLYMPTSLSPPTDLEVKIRTLLRPHDTLNYTGVYSWSGTARFANRDSMPKPVDRDWGVVLSGQGIGLFMSPNDDKSALWAFSRASTEPQTPLRHPIPKPQLTQLLKESESLSSTFPPIVRELVLATDPDTVMLFNAMGSPSLSTLIAPNCSHGRYRDLDRRTQTTP